MATINQYLDDIKFICDSLDKTQIQKFIDTIKENIINSARTLKIEESKKIKN